MVNEFIQPTTYSLWWEVRKRGDDVYKIIRTLQFLFACPLLSLSSKVRRAWCLFPIFLVDAIDLPVLVVIP